MDEDDWLNYDLFRYKETDELIRYGWGTETCRLEERDVKSEWSSLV